MEDQVVTTKEIAEKFNLSVSSINFYTSVGLFEVVDRQGRGNKRLYHLSSVEQRLQVIREMKRRGFPLLLIQESLRRQNTAASA